MWADHENPASLYRTKPECYLFSEKVRFTRPITLRGGWKYKAKEETPFTFDRETVMEQHYPGVFEQFRESGLVR
jgi:hypothetical protein